MFEVDQSVEYFLFDVIGGVFWCLSVCVGIHEVGHALCDVVVGVHENDA